MEQAVRRTLAFLPILCLLAFSNVSRADFDAMGATSAATSQTQANRLAPNNVTQVPPPEFIGVKIRMRAPMWIVYRVLRTSERPANIPSHPRERIVYSVPHL